MKSLRADSSITLVGGYLFRNTYMCSRCKGHVTFGHTQDLFLWKIDNASIFHYRSQMQLNIQNKVTEYWILITPTCVEQRKRNFMGKSQESEHALALKLICSDLWFAHCKWWQGKTFKFWGPDSFFLPTKHLIYCNSWNPVEVINMAKIQNMIYHTGGYGTNYMIHRYFREMSPIFNIIHVGIHVSSRNGVKSPSINQSTKMLL